MIVAVTALIFLSTEGKCVITKCPIVFFVFFRLQFTFVKANF